ncbi:hypothetical protein QF044_003501 [Chryseobacterium sp. W4I1]|nr:hypothetical protein [Chryseobacterium sp. W4I1]
MKYASFFEPLRFIAVFYGIKTILYQNLINNQKKKLTEIQHKIIKKSK